MLFLLVLGLAQIHKYRHKRRLTVGSQQRYHLILYGLHAAADLLAQALFHDFALFLVAAFHAQIADFRLNLSANLLARYVHKRRKVRQRYGLTSVLVGGDLRDYLCGDIARGREAVRALDQRAGNYRAVLQHVLKVYQIAVVHMLGEVVGVVKVDYALVMRLHYFARQQYAVGYIARHLARHVVALGGIDHRVFV